MTVEEMCDIFEDERECDKEDEEVGRSDLRALLMLDQLVSDEKRMISHVMCGRIFLDVDVEKLASVISYAQIVTLVRSGVDVNVEDPGLSISVEF